MCKKIGLILLILIIQGCASTTQKYNYIADKSEGLFVPVRLFVNRAIPVPRFYESRLDYVGMSLKKSGAFIDIGSHIDSPYVLDVRIERGTHDSIADVTGQILSAATLFLVPSIVHNFNKIDADLYIHGKKVKSYSFTEDYEDTLSIANNFDSAGDSNEYKTIHNLTHRLISQLDKDKLLPKE